MKDLKDREIEARARLAERLKRLRTEMIRRPASGPGAPGVRLPRPRPSSRSSRTGGGSGRASAPRSRRTRLRPGLRPTAVISRSCPAPSPPFSSCPSPPCWPAAARPRPPSRSARPSDGGTLLVGGGSGVPAAMRQAVSAIETHCRGVYEVVEVAQVQTGRRPPAGWPTPLAPSLSERPAASPVFGTSITYLCREPQSTALNESVIQMASADIVGRKCRSDDECGPLFCTRVAPAAEFGACAAPVAGSGVR